MLRLGRSMGLPSLSDIKSATAIVDDSGDFDAHLSRLLEAAIAYLNEIGVPCGPDTCPAPVGQAIVIFVKYHFDYGITFDEGSNVHSAFRLPFAFHQLVAPYREVVL